MPTHLYKRVANELRNEIRSGRLAPGSRLPSRKDLCAHFGVSDIVINDAMRILRAEGLVETLVGVGVFVAERPPDPRSAEPDDEEPAES